MRLLLDTHAFLWWRGGSKLLKRAGRDAIANPNNEILISAVVAWEIVTARALHRIDFPGTVTDAIGEEGFSELPITSAHADELGRLPEHHRDPFDRLLVAQARVESLTLVTRDAAIARYHGFGLLVC